VKGHTASRWEHQNNLNSLLFLPPGYVPWRFEMSRRGHYNWWDMSHTLGKDVSAREQVAHGQRGDPGMRDSRVLSRDGF
jgi:hypothetical protein